MSIADAKPSSQRTAGAAAMDLTRTRRREAERTGADLAMERYANGDDAAFGEVYDALAPRLQAYLRKTTRDESVADDLLQLTLLQMHRARGSFLPGAAVAPWAFAIARRLVIDGARRRRLERKLFAEPSRDAEEVVFQPVADTAAADDLVDAQRLEWRIRGALESLPEIQRTAYRLLQQDGLTLKGAAEVLGISVTAVKLRAHRAYQALRAVVREAEGTS
jgi:RNA polymerase sigma-70 factor (ECF subfamily)